MENVHCRDTYMYMYIILESWFLSSGTEEVDILRMLTPSSLNGQLAIGNYI